MAISGFGRIGALVICLALLVVGANAQGKFAVALQDLVDVKVEIDENGDDVLAKMVLEHPLFREVSESAALQSKFPPTIVDGKPVRVTGIITYTFSP